MSNISPEEKQTHISLWKESGLNKMKYCEQAKISYKAFIHWVRRYAPSLSPSRKRKTKKKSAFIPIALSEEKTEKRITHVIEIRYPNGIQLTCPIGVDISVLKSLLQ